MKYLFIAGCARSGTSVLTKLIGAHASVVLGMERFGHLVLPGNFKLTQRHFEADRFLNVEPNDTFYSDFREFHRWDPAIESKIKSGNLAYIGDKRPELYLVYDELFSEFPEAKVLFIYRDVLAVAASWNKRAKEGESWPAQRNFQTAVHAWNYAMKVTLEALEKYDNLACVCYEDVFIDGLPIDPIYQWLELDIDLNTKIMIKNTLINSKKLIETRKEFDLTPSEKDFVLQNTSFRYKKMMDRHNLLAKFASERSETCSEEQ